MSPLGRCFLPLFCCRREKCEFWEELSPILVLTTGHKEGGGFAIFLLEAYFSYELGKLKV